jgi:4-amino-4-deoxy-L-arabinose transferase-like glycosyltransferase
VQGVIPSGRILRFHPLELAAMLLVMLSAIWLIPRFGPEQDELLFVKPVFNSRIAHSTVTVFGKPLPLMLMSYLGAPKVYAYKIIFAIFPPSLWSLRLPPLLLLLGSALLVRAALLRLGHRTAAAAYFVLFLVSPSIIVTSVIDWGPVCLQFALFGMVLYFLARASLKPEYKWFVLAGFFFGLGVWDKLTFFVCFAPPALLLLASVLWRLSRAKTIKLLAATALAAALGMFPFIAAALQHKVHSVQQLQWEAEPFQSKFMMLSRSLAGTVLTGSLTSRDGYADAVEGSLPRLIARMTEAIMNWSGFDLWILFAVAAFTIAIPGPTLRTRILLTACFLLSWLAMAAFRNLGASGHHTVLLHPVILLAFALALQDGWRQPRLRPLCLLPAAVLLAANLVALTDFVFRVNNLPIPTAWSPAIAVAARAVAAGHSRNVFVDGWGLDSAVILFSRGRIWPREAISQYWREEVTELDRECAARAVSEPDAIFFGFAPGRSMPPKGPALLAEAARLNGLERIVTDEFKDRQGQPIVILYRFHKP